MQRTSTRIWKWRFALIACMLVFSSLFVVGSAQTTSVLAAANPTPQTPKAQGVSVKKFGAVGDGVKDDTEALVNASKLTGAIYFPTGTYVLKSSLSFGENTILVFGDNARILTSTGVILRVDGSAKAGLYQIFSGTGTVVGQAKNVKDVYPEWFGAKGDAVADDRPSIQAAVNFAGQLSKGGTVIFSEGRYYILGTMTAPKKNFVWLNGNVSLSGKGIVKVANQSGTYKSIFEYTTPVSNISVTNLTIDSNSANNPRTGTPDYATDARIEVQMTTGKAVKIDSITIKNSLAVQSLMMNAVSNVTVTNSFFLQMGANTNLFFDTSAIYIVGDNSTVANNQFEATGSGANTAIEVHGTTKTVKGNVIKKYRTGILYATETNPNEENRDSLITNNQMLDTMFGLSLWAVNGNISTLTIENNYIRVHAAGGGNYAPDEQASGIQFYNPSTYKWSNIVIRSNTIDFINPGNGYMTTNQHAAGIDLALYGSGTNVDGLLIANNFIRNAYANGISWSILGPQTGVIVERNTIVNPGSLYNGNSGYSSGIALYGNRSFISCYVRNNSISDDRTPAKMYTGLLLYSPGTYDNAATQLYWQNNSIASNSSLLSGKAMITEGNTPIIQTTPF